MLCFIVVITSCQSVLTPRVVLWHTWDGDQANVINATVGRFSQIFEDAVVVASFVPADELVERYTVTSEQGLGPDVFIAPNSALRDLADAGLIRYLPDDTLNPSAYYNAALATAMYQNKLYGIPFSMRPTAMYYNLDLIETPATTLSELVTQTEMGTGVALNTQFREILWGIQAYGGQVIDDNGRITLNQGAFTNWLNWLLTANANPEMFLSRDATTLRRLFIDGRVAYYMGSPDELPLLREQMGEDKVGVAPLPAGPNGASGPLMQSDVLLFNPSSAPNAQEHAIELALFLTNLEQANVFMRDLQLVPANRQVRVDLRTYPAIAGFIAQTRTAINIPYLSQVTQLLEDGDDMLLRVLEGVVAPNIAADELTNSINAEVGLSTIELPVMCDLVGNLVLWHSLTNAAEEYIDNLTTRLNVNCLDFRLQTIYVPPGEIVSAYIELFIQDNAPDIVLTTSDNLIAMLEANAIQPIDRDLMQAYSPIAQQTVTSGNVPYGIPVALRGNVFYYNRDVIADAPVTTDDLLVEASPAFSLSRNADSMLWTLTAYNGITVVDNVIIPDQQQLTTWIDWLRRIDESEHIGITANAFLRGSEFLASQSVYYVDSNLRLAEFSSILGDALAVAPFPTGTSTFASPLVTSYSLFHNPSSENLDTALAFSKLVTDIEEQENLVDILRWIPSNTTTNVSLTTDSLVATISDILQTGIVINSDTSLLLSEVSRALDRALRTDQPSEEIAEDIFNALSVNEVD